MIDANAVPRLAPGVRLREDPARGWVVMAPERVFVPDAIALEVLRLVDGARRIYEITDQLATRFAAPRAEIAADVAELLGDLQARGVVRI